MKRRLRKLLLLRSGILIAALIMLTGFYQSSFEARPKLRRISHSSQTIQPKAPLKPVQKFEALRIPQAKLHGTNTLKIEADKAALPGAKLAPEQKPASL